MIKKIYCMSCDEVKDCDLHQENITKKIDGIDISYLRKYYICSSCGDEVYDNEIIDYNVSAANEELRKKTGLITKSEIREILSKYSISQKNLSKVLGFGEIQISRYLKSGNPSKEHSDILKSIKDNPFIFEGYLLNSNGILEEKIYKKQLGKVRQIELTNIHSKIYNVGIYIMETTHDITNLSLQKILYFLYGFSNELLGYHLFDELPKAWIHGPVYNNIYDAFSYYFNEIIDPSEILKNKELDLTEEEKKYIDCVASFFTCYSGSKLRNMSHLTEPWIKARKGLQDDERSDRDIESSDISKYFKKIIEEYKICTYDDVKKYAEDLFKRTNDYKNK